MKLVFDKVKKVKAKGKYDKELRDAFLIDEGLIYVPPQDKYECPCITNAVYNRFSKFYEYTDDDEYLNLPNSKNIKMVK